MNRGGEEGRGVAAGRAEAEGEGLEGKEGCVEERVATAAGEEERASWVERGATAERKEGKEEREVSMVDSAAGLLAGHPFRKLTASLRFRS